MAPAPARALALASAWFTGVFGGGGAWRAWRRGSSLLNRAAAPCAPPLLRGAALEGDAAVDCDAMVEGDATHLLKGFTTAARRTSSCATTSTSTSTSTSTFMTLHDGRKHGRRG